MNQRIRKFGPRHLPALLVLFSLAASAYSLQAQEARASSADSTEQQQIKAMQEIEDRWSDALVKRDQYGLENTLSPQFVDISAQGDITTRNQQVARLFVKDVNILEFSQKVISTRVFGETALVTGTYTLRRKEASGNVTEKGVFTHVFGRTRSGWLCLQSQRTIVVEQASSRKAAKKSSAQEPFHVPFFHKGAESAAPALPDSSSAPSPAPR